MPRWRVWPAAALTLALVQSVPKLAAQASTPPCELSTAEAGWIQRALDGWSAVSDNALHFAAAPLPWTVLFDTTCAWHLAATADTVPDAVAVTTPLSFAGAPVAVKAVPHRGVIHLPNGRDVPAQPIAMASMYRDGTATFFVMALPTVWRADPRYARDQQLEEFFLGVLTHEMVHTRHLFTIIKQAEALARQYSLPDLQLDDDVIQNRFQGVPAFRRAFEVERDVFFRAVAETRPARRRALVAQGLAMARERRRRHFTGANRLYADLEDLFLSMEGAGQWAAYEFAKANPRVTPAAAVAFVRATRRYWSQDEGLALFLLLDGMVPDWQSRVFGSTPVSLFMLLEEALSQSR
jgi:hypothetical protein